MSITYVSWNIQYLGPSKLKDTKTVLDTQVLTAMAEYIVAMKADIVAIMEVTLKTDGTDAVKQICKLLGDSWDGGSTSNDGTIKPDRYGILYNKNTVYLNGQYWPDEDPHKNVIVFPNRNPTLYHFYSLAQQPKMDFSIMVLHGPNPSEQGGDAAVWAMDDLACLNYVRNPLTPMIISGDFNVDYNANSEPYEDFEAYNYRILLQGNKTSLKTKFETQQNAGTYLSCAYDNILMTNNLNGNLVRYGVYDFVGYSGSIQNLPAYNNCTDQQKAQWQNTLTQCRRVSDHLPVYITLNI